MQHAPTLWEEGRTPGSEVAALVVALLLTGVVFDLVTSLPLGLVFDLSFIALSMGAALSVRPADFFVIGVLPPLAMLLTVVLLATTEPASIARAGDGVAQATITGLSGHSVALVVGYVSCLAVLAVRRHVAERRRSEERSRPLDDDRRVLARAHRE